MTNKSIIPLLISSITILLVILIDIFILDRYLIMEGPPIFDFVYVARSLLILLGSCFFIIFVIKNCFLKYEQKLQEILDHGWNNSGLFAWSVTRSPAINKMILLMVLSISQLFLAIFIINPELFYRLGREWRPIELLSASLWFFSGCIFIYIFFILRQNVNNDRNIYLIIAFLFAFIFYFVGLEEVSWFQYVLTIETPDIFAGNMQGELNLHNFATDIVENAYYFVTFIFLILIPFINEKAFFNDKYKILSFFIPSRFILFLSTINIIYNYDMWNILFTQLSFFITLIILIHYVYSCIRFHKNIFIMLLIVITFIYTQVLFLMLGKTFVRTWDVTEYKEFFIPLSFFLYSIEILNKAKNFRKIRTGFNN